MGFLEECSEVIDRLSQGLVIHDPNEAVVKFNKTALDILVLTEEQLLGKDNTDPQWRMIDEKGEPFPYEEIPSHVTIETGEEVHNVIMGIETADQMKWISITSIPLEKPEGTFAVVTFTDITNERLSNIQTEMALEAASIGVWRFNVQTNELIWDESMYALYEVNPEDFTGDYDAWEKTLHHEDKPRTANEVQLAIRGEKEFSTAFRIVAGDNIKYIKAKAEVVLDTQGKPMWMVGVNWDITKEKNNEKLMLKRYQQLEEVNKMKDSFISTMSHEIRTPLNGILGMTEFLTRSAKGEAVESLRIIKESGEHLNALIGDILDFSKIKAGHFEMDEQQFNLKVLIEDCIELYSPKIKKDCEIFFNMKSDVNECIISDRTRIKQVITNLISNAVKFTEKGKISVDVVAMGCGPCADYKITITDTGIGIPREKQKDIFSDFFQADGSHTRSYGGTGLGLAISKKIVEAMGGKISFVSKEGAGSTFWIKINFKNKLCGNDCDSCILKEKERIEYQEQENREQKELFSDEEEMVISNQKTILLVEDNIVNVKVATLLLESSGYEVITAYDGIQAMEAFNDNHETVDLIMLDIHMPKMDGIEALEAIRKLNKTVPIFMVTAESNDEFKKEVLGMGANEFILKPFKKKEVISYLDKYLKEQQ